MTDRLAVADDDRRNPDRPDRRVSGPTRAIGGRRASDRIACPACGHASSRVLPHRPTIEQQMDDGFWRRRRCEKCHHRFNTRETAIDTQ